MKYRAWFADPADIDATLLFVVRYLDADNAEYLTIENGVEQWHLYSGYDVIQPAYRFPPGLAGFAIRNAIDEYAAQRGNLASVLHQLWKEVKTVRNGAE